MSVSDDRVVAWAQAFVRFESPQTDAFEAEPRVLAFLDEAVGPLLAELGLPVATDPMGSKIVDLGDQARAPDLMFIGYAMTHPAADMVDPFAGELVTRQGQECVRGRGVSEQKASLAATIAAVARAARRIDGRRIVLAVTPAGETGRHDAARAVIDRVGTPRKAVIGIGTDNRVALGNKGRIDVFVDIHGRAAHSSTPEAGVNAIEGARILLNRLTTLAPQTPEHAHLGAATLVATAIDSWPKATHTIQSHARLVLDRRLLPGEEPAEAFAALAAGLKLPEPWRSEVSLGPVMYPCVLDPDGELLQAIRQAARVAGWPTCGSFWMKGALDAGLIQHLGGEAAMWGPGDPAQWHSNDEVAPVRDLLAAARAYESLIDAV